MFKKELVSKLVVLVAAAAEMAEGEV